MAKQVVCKVSLDNFLQMDDSMEDCNHPAKTEVSQRLTKETQLASIMENVLQPAAPEASLHKETKCSSKPHPYEPSTSAADELELLDLVPIPCASIAPEDLPVVSKVAPGPQPSSAPHHDDSPLMIHGHSVEDYQRIYHEVVDDILKFNSGRPRPYSLVLGYWIKRKLWQRLKCPRLRSSVNEDGLVQVEESYGAGVYPPLYDVDTSEEPWPELPPTNCYEDL